MQKKRVKFDEDKQMKSTSMMVGKDGNDTEAEDEDDLDVEGELYNLMRGNASLMIAAASDDSDDESEENDAEEQQQESKCQWKHLS